MRAAQRVLRAVVQSRVLWLCLGAMLVSSGAQAQLDMPGAAKWAIVIGVQQYSQRTGFAPLRYTEKDAQVFYDVLVDPQRGGYEDGRVKLLTTGAKEPDRQPTRGNILGALELLASWAQADAQSAPDTVVLYYSGHGVEQDGQSYLIPSDAARTDLDNTALSLDLVREKLALTDAKKQIVIVDACRFQSVPGKAGGDRQSVEFARTLEEFARAEGRVVLASCSSNQASYEDEERGHSAFTGILLDGLLGAADGNADGMITLTESYEYLTRELRSWAEKRGIVQYPSLYGEITLTLPLVRCPKWAELRISSVPDEAEIWIDGENTGHKTPHTLKLSMSSGDARTLAVHLKKEGYEDLTRDVTLHADEKKPLLVGLKEVSTPVGREERVTLAGPGTPWLYICGVEWLHSVEWDGSESWGHRMRVGFNDALGPDNVQTVTITDPTGRVYRIPGCEYYIMSEGEPGRKIACADHFDSPPTFSGVYAFVATNWQGTSSIVQHVRVPAFSDEFAPVITSPSSGAVVRESAPLFSWDPIPEPRWINRIIVAEVIAGAREPIWTVDEPFGKGQAWLSLAYNFDGTASQPELIPGHTYEVGVQVHHYWSEGVGVSAWRWVRFSVARPEG